MTLGTRSVRRDLKTIAGLDWPTCEWCGEHIKYAAPATLRSLRRRGLPAHTHQIISNIYIDGRWDRVEHRHEACWFEAGEPWGPLHTDNPYAQETT